jgi:hypothetical protein
MFLLYKRLVASAPGDVVGILVGITVLGFQVKFDRLLSVCQSMEFFDCKRDLDDDSMV